MKIVTPKEAWINWLKAYGADKFYDIFVATAQNAESECVHCKQKIYLDLVEGGGCVSFRTSDGDFGCNNSPDTTTDGAGEHVPRKL